MWRFSVFILFIFSFHISFTQTKSLKAFKLSAAPKIDGLLTDTVWQNVPIATNFIVNQPAFGNPAAQKTNVKIAYDDEALYVAAFLYDKPTEIRKQLTARDGESRQDVDVFGIVVDTYNDKQNAFQFLVTPANVQSDIRISSTSGSDGNDGYDVNWDAVWDSKVVITDSGWNVEMKIPYMSLRFAKKDIQDWGLNLYRFIRRLNENSYWNPINPQTSGYVNQFGLLKGLQNLQPPLRLSFLPYVSSGYSTVPTNNGTINTFLRNGGMDVKYGINQSFTMDMTLIPDFGQVQSDNVILNLSPFEIQFNENRPFFTEGTELFNKAGIFYSRRIGGTPRGYYAARKLAADSNYTIQKNPSTTQLYNATKFSGRTNKNLGIGVFNAVTAPMSATFTNDKGESISIQTESLTNYNIVVLDQALKNRSSIAFTNANVWRKDKSRQANVTALDISLFDKANQYNFIAKGRFSSITGVEKYTGFKSEIGFQKVSGVWQWSINNNIESDKYDPNDLGYLQAPNEVSTAANISFNQFTPNKHFNYRNYSFGITYRSLYKPFTYTGVSYGANFLHVFKNFWDISLSLDGNPFWQHDYFELRTDNRMMRKVPWWFAGIFGSTDSRKKLFVSYGFGYSNLYTGNNFPFYLYRWSVRYRFNTKLSLQLNSETQTDEGEYGFSHFDANGEPIVGRRFAVRVNNILSGAYNFKARMNLTIRARHYWSKVNYKQLYNIDNNGFWEQYPLPFSSAYDRNFNAFNIDAFFTWDFRLGSRLIVAWKNALGPDVAIDGLENRKYVQNLSRTLSAVHSNEVSMKLVYFVDYNQLKRKKHTAL